MPDEPVATEEEAPEEAAVEKGGSLAVEREALEEGEAAVEEGGSLAEEREALAGGEAGVVEREALEEAAGEEGESLEEREALEEATGAFLEEEAGCLARLLEEKRASMLEKV